MPKGTYYGILWQRLLLHKTQDETSTDYLFLGGKQGCIISAGSKHNNNDIWNYWSVNQNRTKVSNYQPFTHRFRKLRWSPKAYTHVIMWVYGSYNKIILQLCTYSCDITTILHHTLYTYLYTYIYIYIYIYMHYYINN